MRLIVRENLFKKFEKQTRTFCHFQNYRQTRDACQDCMEKKSFFRFFVSFVVTNPYDLGSKIRSWIFLKKRTLSSRQDQKSIRWALHGEAIGICGIPSRYMCSLLRELDPKGTAVRRTIHACIDGWSRKVL